MTTSNRSAQLLADLVGHPGTGDTLAERLCWSLAGALRVRGVSISLLSPRGPQSLLAASDAAARALADLQFSTGEGPGILAMSHGAPVLVPDLLENAFTPWIAFGPAAVALGARAVFAFPLRVGAIRIGALDLHRGSPGELSDSDLGEALAYAEAATLIVLHLQNDARVDPTVSLALDTRPVVHQATGMVSEQLRITLDEALLRLRARAFAGSTGLSDLSAAVVGRRVRFDATAEFGDNGPPREDLTTPDPDDPETRP